jgi:hypothetical protein
MQKLGHKVGVLTANPNHDKENNLDLLAKLSIKPDFYVGKPDDLRDYPDGIFKGKVCNELDIDVLFDDFNHNDDKMIADFFTINSKTIPFTSWGLVNLVDSSDIS